MIALQTEPTFALLFVLLQLTLVLWVALDLVRPVYATQEGSKR